MQRLLSEKATEVNTRDEDEYTPLHRAAYSGHLDIVRELVAQGADVHAVTVDGWTPLHSACKWNNTRVASFLLQHDADINAQTKEVTMASLPIRYLKFLIYLMMSQFSYPPLGVTA